MNIYNNHIAHLVPDRFKRQRAAPVTWGLVNTGRLRSAHKWVSSGGLLCACGLDLAAQRRKSNAHVANRQTWVSANMADLLRGQIRDNRLSSFTLLFTSGPSSTSLPPSFQSQLRRKRLLWDAVAESKSSPWQRRPVSPSLSFIVFCLSHRPHHCVSACDLRCTHTHKETKEKCTHNMHTHADTQTLHFFYSTWYCSDLLYGVFPLAFACT